MSTGMEAAQSGSATIYYRGVSMIITARDKDADVTTISNKLMEEIDRLLDTKGCKPSWNEETNKQALSQPKVEATREVSTTASTPKTSMSVEEFEKKCPNCGVAKVRNPKNGNWFCPDKCWLKGQANYQNK